MLDEELQQYFSDLLFRVSLQTGRDAYVYVLLEHKSYVERFAALQLLRYKVEIWEQAHAEAKAAANPQKRSAVRKLPPIFPLIVYHGTRKWQIAQQFADLVEGGESVAVICPIFAMKWLPVRGYSRDRTL